MFLMYRITNTVAGKSYIGITGKSAEQRFAQHMRIARSGKGGSLHRSMRKHGVECFSVEPVANFESRSDVLEAEVRAIKKENTKAPNGYNMTQGGEGVVSLCQSALDIKVKKARDLHSDKEFKKRHSEGIASHWASIRGDAHRAAISRAKKGKPQPRHVLDAAAKAKRTPEYRDKASKATSKLWEDSSFRDRVVESRKANHTKRAKKFPYCVDSGVLYATTRDACRAMRNDGYEKAAPNNICLACSGKYQSSYGKRWKWMTREDMESKKMVPVRVS